MPKDLEYAYLYEPGVRGLPLVNLVPQPTAAISLIGDVESGSGRMISYNFQGRSIRIIDEGYPIDQQKPRLQAYFTLDNEVGFNLRRWLPNTNPIEKHPDFFPPQFMEFALAYFAKCGHDISLVVGQWKTDSVNFQTFTEKVNLGDSYQEAARKTWTARVLSKLDYSLNDIRVHKNADKEITLIDAKFRRLS